MPDPISTAGTEVIQPELGWVTIEYGMAVIRIPLAEVHGLRVALHPCPCKAPKSHVTTEIRDRLDKALAKLGRVSA